MVFFVWLLVLVLACLARVLDAASTNILAAYAKKLAAAKIAADGSTAAAAMAGVGACEVGDAAFLPATVTLYAPHLQRRDRCACPWKKVPCYFGFAKRLKQQCHRTALFAIPTLTGADLAWADGHVRLACREGKLFVAECTAAGCAPSSCGLWRPLSVGGFQPGACLDRALQISCPIAYPSSGRALGGGARGRAVDGSPAPGKSKWKAGQKQKHKKG